MFSRLAICLLMLAAMALSGAAMAQDTTPRNVADVFPLGIYWPWERVNGAAERMGLEKWEYVAQRLDEMRAHNVDSVWAVNLNATDLPKLAKLLADREMTFVPAMDTLHYNIPWRHKNWTYLEAKSREAMEAAGDSPSVIAWALCDEPRASFVDDMEIYRRKFAEWGAKQPGIVVTMWHDTPAYAERSDFPVICPDIYPYFAPGNPNGPNTTGSSRGWYRRHATAAGRLAYENGAVPWIMPQSFHDVWGPWEYREDGNVTMLPGSVLHWRPPTVGEMRWQVWSALAAGVQGFYWFCYAPPPSGNPDAKPYVGNTFPEALVLKERDDLDFTGALIGPDAQITPQYEAVGEVFGKVKRLIPVLKGAAPSDMPLGEVDAPGWIGTLRQPDGGLVAVLVNDDTEAERELTVWLAKPNDVKDALTGVVLPRNADNTISVTLGPGEGMVLVPAE